MIELIDPAAVAVALLVAAGLGALAMLALVGPRRRL